MLTFKIIKNELPLEARFIREEVFVKEQGFKEEFDSIDNFATHILAFKDNKAVGTARFFHSVKENKYLIGRLAVLKEYRKQNIGKEILKVIEEELKKVSINKVYLASQKRAVIFYEKCGYIKEGDYFLDEHYPHIWMYKNL